MAGGASRQGKSGGPAEAEPPLDRLSSKMRGLERQRALEFQCRVGFGVEVPCGEASDADDCHARAQEAGLDRGGIRPMHAR